MKTVVDEDVKKPTKQTKHDENAECLIVSPIKISHGAQFPIIPNGHLYSVCLLI